MELKTHRYKMAGQWFTLPKLFEASRNEGYEIVRSDDEVIQFKNEQSWTFKIIPKTATINALVTLSLDLKQFTAISSALSITRIKPTTRITALKSWDSLSRSRRLTKLSST